MINKQPIVKNPYADLAYIAVQAIGYLVKLGVFEEFKTMIARHPEDLTALEALEKTWHKKKHIDERMEEELK